MAKDPAFLFYSQDFLVGTMAMPFEDRGKYITLLCYMHQNGHISEETIRLLVGSVSDILRLKFQIDETGKWFNERLDIEAAKRAKFTESRVLNGNKGGRPKKEEPTEKLQETTRLSIDKPKENLIENEDESVNENGFKIELPLNVETIYDKIINYYNLKTGQKLKSSTKSTKKDIDILLKQKFTFDDFAMVIDKKYDDWINDSEMCQYIRPSTLFSKKFETYLIQPIIKTHKKYESNGTISTQREPFKL